MIQIVKFRTFVYDNLEKQKKFELIEIFARKPETDETELVVYQGKYQWVALNY